MSPLLALALLLPLAADPLPPGAVARFGSNRLRCTDGARLSADGRTVFGLHAGVVRGYAADTLARVLVLPTAAAECLRTGGRVAAWSADGRFLATATEIGPGTPNGPATSTTRLTVYDLRSGNAVGGFRHPFVWNGELSADGRTFVAVVTDPAGPGVQPPLRVTAWDVPAGSRRTLLRLRPETQLRTAIAPTGDAILVAVTPTGGGVEETICIGLADGTVRWRENGAVSGFAFTPDGTVLVTANTARGRVVTTRDLRTGGPVPGVRVPQATVQWLDTPDRPVFSPDGSRMAFTVRMDSAGCLKEVPPQSLLIWNLRTGTTEAEWRLPKDVFVAPIGFATDGRHLLADWGGQLRRIDLSSGRTNTIDAPPGHAGSVEQLAFAADGRTLVSHGFADVWAWDVRAAAAARTHWARTPFTPPGVLSADGRYVWAVTKPGRVTARDTRGGTSTVGFDVPTETPQPQFAAAPPPIIPAVAVAPVAKDPIEEAFEELSGTAPVRGFFAAQHIPIVALFVWDAVGGLPPKPAAPPVGLPPPPPPPQPMCCDASGRPYGFLSVRPDRSAVVHYDPAAGVYTGHEPASGKQLWRAARSPGDGREASFRGGPLSPDGRFHATPVGPIDTRTGQATTRWTLPDGGSVGFELCVSSDSRLVAGVIHRPSTTQPAPVAVAVWEVATGATVAVRENVRGPSEFAFTPAGDRLLLACADGLAIWNLQTDAWTVPHSDAAITGGGISALAVSPDGSKVAVGNRDGTVLLWPLPPATGTSVSVADSWERLSRPDGYTGIWAMVSRADEAVLLIDAKLKTPPAPTAGTVVEWVRALDSPRYTERETATRSLRAAGAAAETELRQAVLSESPEVRRRAEVLLAGFVRPVSSTADGLRALRAVAVLEHVGTPAARRVLERIAVGPPPLSVAAGDALARLNARHGSDLK